MFVFVFFIEKEDFLIEDMVDDFITFFAAGKLNLYKLYIIKLLNYFYLTNEGQETTASTLTSVFLELGRNPHILEKCYC